MPRNFMKTVLATAALAALTAGTAHADGPRVAVALPGIITDRAFNENVYAGLVQAAEEHGAETAYTENVSQATQVEVMSDYARRGYDIVVGAGGEYTDAAERVAANFPETTVIVINGAPTEGVTTLNYSNPEFGYLVGLVAGHVSETGVAAAISAQEFAAFTNVVDGFRRGFQEARPDGEVLVAYTNDWADIAKAKEASFNLISQDADPARVLSWAVGMYKEGTLEPTDYVIHLTSADQLGDFSDAVSEEVRALALEAVEKIKSGELTFD